jgi:hypothetical protein
MKYAERALVPHVEEENEIEPDIIDMFENFNQDMKD